MEKQENYGKGPVVNGRDLPNLKNEKIIGLDTETHDPDLKKKGPGVRRDGYLIGISVATVDGRSWYIPFGHEIGQQLEKSVVRRWARDQLCNPGQAKVGANILYDLDYLYHWGIPVSGPFYDVQIAEPLLNENLPIYSLESLGKRYLNRGKSEDDLLEFCSVMGWKGKPQAHLWRMDPRIVAPYAEEDASMVLQILEKQKKALELEGLSELFDMETRLIPMILYMRSIGVPINESKLHDAHAEITDQLKIKRKELGDVDIWAAASIAKVFNREQLEYPLTPKTKKPSFTRQWLANHPHPIAKEIVQCRELDKLVGTFLEGSLLNVIINGRIHCQFNQLKSDDSGTVTGRFSSSNPNLQFIPTRTEMGKQLRRMFIPDDGYGWAKLDYSQIELRVLAHYAMGNGSTEIRQAYCDDPRMDLHQWCADEVGITRTAAKTINFGIVYGMGAKLLGESLGMSTDEARIFLNGYFKRLPFIQTTIKKAMKVAESRGYVYTILGRRRRFVNWEAADFNLSKALPSRQSQEEMMSQVESARKGNPGFRPGIKRAGCYKAFNAVDQGSSADIMKKAMVDIWESGVCNTILPYITVHDELDFGYPLTPEGHDAIQTVKDLMEKTVELKVPLIVDAEVGDNWGDLHEYAR